MKSLPRILVIEDHAAIASLVSLLLHPSGWSVQITPNPRQALALARNGAADVLLTDYLMPDMDGLQVIGQLRQEGHMLPVVLMSALPSEVDLEEAERLQVITVLDKSNLPTALIPALKTALQTVNADSPI